MRRIALFALALLFMAGAHAEAQPEIAVRGNVGAAFFQSPEGLNSVLNSGVDLGLGARVSLYEGLEVLLQGGYDRFTLNGDNVALFAEDLKVGPSSRVEGGSFYLLNATTGLRYVFHTSSDAQPYVSTGVGIYRTSIAETRIYRSNQLVQREAERTTYSTGVHAALGVDFQINETYSFFFEPRYVIVFTDDRELRIGRSTRYIPVRLGIDMEL